MIRALLKVNGIQVRDVHTYDMKGEGPFSVKSSDEYFRVTLDLPDYVSLQDLNKISRLLGTDDIEVCSFEDPDGYYIELHASHVDRDNVKIQAIYAESRRG
jgi:hypothetical protein